VDEAVQVGKGGARVWRLKNISWHGEGISGVSAADFPYYLGLSYAPQYYADPIQREEFARAFEKELKRIAAEK
jgi:hypothetical protein